MVSARRAKVRPARIVVPLVAAAALLTGGFFAATRIGSDSTASSEPPGASPAALTSTSPTESTTSPHPGRASHSPSPAASTSVARADAVAADGLRACQERGRAADEVLAEADTGVGHWTEHIQAQADHTSGKISVGEMKGHFKRTRLAGPEDQRRYTKAFTRYSRVKGSCHPVKGASPAMDAEFTQCAARFRAQQPVMQAGAKGMGDWKRHLADMKRSSKEYVPKAKQIWLDAAAAAPKNINAYNLAVDGFDAPSC